MDAGARFRRKWAARGAPAPGELHVLPAVEAPQLGNRRDVLVYLPASYFATDRPFPVLYMHDGQNLLDPTTSFAGEWGVDAALAALPSGAGDMVVVALPNMGADRLREYSPWVDPRAGGGAGDAYVAFVAETVKPLVDARFRTRPGREATAILGSSMGGLISLYAFFHAPATFGAAGAMSPALWFAERAIFPYVEDAAAPSGRLYLDVGTREGDGTLRDARAMRTLLEDRGYRMGGSMRWVEDEGGQHHEAAWGRRFAEAARFLLGGVA